MRAKLMQIRTNQTRLARFKFPLALFSSSTGREQSGGMNRPAIQDVSVRSPRLAYEQSIEPE
jgi:hypothetical protein